MTHLQCDQQSMKDISNGYSRDPSFNGNTLPAGVILDPNAGLYRIADKIYVPNTLALQNRLIEEFYNTVGHPDQEHISSVIL